MTSHVPTHLSHFDGSEVFPRNRSTSKEKPFSLGALYSGGSPPPISRISIGGEVTNLNEMRKATHDFKFYLPIS